MKKKLTCPCKRQKWNICAAWQSSQDCRNSGLPCRIASGNPPRNDMRAFTLAEVLITLGIIGVVAALTLPALIAHHKKHIVETQLKRFYSNMNQAIKLSEVDNGPVEDWSWWNEESKLNWFNIYLRPYLKVTDVKTITPEFLEIYFADGSMDYVTYNGRDHIYFISAEQYRKNKAKHGRDVFMFAIYPAGAAGLRDTEFKGKRLEPYIHRTWNGILDTENLILDGQLGGYAKSIQINGWKIPDDYPIKF